MESDFYRESWRMSHGAESGKERKRGWEGVAHAKEEQEVMFRDKRNKGLKERRAAAGVEEEERMKKLQGQQMCL